jgi:hypothetical protein
MSSQSLRESEEIEMGINLPVRSSQILTKYHRSSQILMKYHRRSRIKLVTAEENEKFVLW